ncbi:MAG: TraR/DksA C4-type zinc finger protein [Candidatus Cloacimonetes bacterium]|nr:TraR/DksA C4-type zinc finger protein [Candidatus Cloacimonadota bacterium]
MAAKPLSDDKLKHYSENLTKEKEETIRIIGDISDRQRRGAKNGSGDLSSFALHQADQGTDTDTMEREVYLLEQEQRKLKLLNLAFKRIYEKTYGICEMCGCYIPEPRLKIIPYAATCIECKSNEEKKSSRGR